MPRLGRRKPHQLKKDAGGSSAGSGAYCQPGPVPSVVRHLSIWRNFIILENNVPSWRTICQVGGHFLSGWRTFCQVEEHFAKLKNILPSRNTFAKLEDKLLDCLYPMLYTSRHRGRLGYPRSHHISCFIFSAVGSFSTLRQNGGVFV